MANLNDFSASYNALGIQNKEFSSALTEAKAAAGAAAAKQE